MLISLSLLKSTPQWSSAKKEHLSKKESNCCWCYEWLYPIKGKMQLKSCRTSYFSSMAKARWDECLFEIFRREYSKKAGGIDSTREVIIIMVIKDSMSVVGSDQYNNQGIAFIKFPRCWLSIWHSYSHLANSKDYYLLFSPLPSYSFNYNYSLACSSFSPLLLIFFLLDFPKALV